MKEHRSAQRDLGNPATPLERPGLARRRRLWAYLAYKAYLSNRHLTFYAA
ncbi:MAG: hypothetical protein WKF75_18745 [Singulisphaera sp.]